MLSEDFVCPEAPFEELDLLEPLLEPVLEEPPLTDALSSADDEAPLPPEDDADAAVSEEVDDTEALPDPETPSSAFSVASAEPAPSSSCASELF